MIMIEGEIFIFTFWKDKKKEEYIVGKDSILEKNINVLLIITHHNRRRQ